MTTPTALSYSTTLAGPPISASNSPFPSFLSRTQALSSLPHIMALVNLTNIVVLDNPTSFTNPFTFEVTFECVQELEDGMWLGGVCVAEERGDVIIC
jgi:hypothetical protein